MVLGAAPLVLGPKHALNLDSAINKFNSHLIFLCLCMPFQALSFDALISLDLDTFTGDALYAYFERLAHYVARAVRQHSYVPHHTMPRNVTPCHTSFAVYVAPHLL